MNKSENKNKVYLDRLPLLFKVIRNPFFTAKTTYETVSNA
jgi:hypothetical protein